MDDSDDDVTDVIFNCGLNNFNEDHDVAIANKIIDGLKALKIRYKYADIFWFPLLPIKSKTVTARCSMINCIVRNYCNRENLQVIDNGTLFFNKRTGIKFDMLAKDKIHPSRLGNAAIGKHIKYFLYNLCDPRRSMPNCTPPPFS